MRNFTGIAGYLIGLLVAAQLCAAPAASNYAQQPEIVIEMHGDDTPSTTVPTLSIWNKNTTQLLRALKGQTREQALYEIDTVSTQDRILSGTKGKFALVEYTQKNTAVFRKLLFQADDPQTFITAASTVADVLAINKKYGLTIPVSQALFESTYAGKYSAEPLTDAAALPERTYLYKMAYQDVNTPKAQDHWFLFENKQLTRIFYTEPEKQEYVKSLVASAQPAETSVPVKAPAKKSTVRKALVSGGTVWDQMYMPRVVPKKPKNNTADTEKK